MNLVIVESPAKSKTIKKFLGNDYEILASYGHVRDLITKEGAVNPEDGFKMTYAALEDSKRALQKIAQTLKKADALYLATDPDREGEAISWHLHELLKEKHLLKNKDVHRVVFHEITEKAICEAFAQPRELSVNLINAQQARRALDYLVGFNLSPLLWRKIKSGLSAGRVQSPALRMIAEREAEIEAFKPREYWTIETQLAKATDAKANAKAIFPARLFSIEDKKLEQFDINNSEDAHRIRDDLEQLIKNEGLTVAKIEKKEKKRNPQPPFITSTLQQDAARKLGLSAKQTMRIAQQLYEGVDLEKSSVGLITYMRTDSVTLASIAVEEIRKQIKQTYGAHCLPEKPRQFKTKSKNAQEAHEAIRPTSALRTPESVKKFMTYDQLRLYELIWKRTIACQMTPAILDTVSADIQCGKYTLRATGSTVREPGFMQVYTEGSDTATSKSQKNEKDERKLPPLKVGESLTLIKLDANQHFTEPPPRYSEASLIKSLEEYGIGRPSTYASIISTLQGRGYAELIKKRFHPTDTGKIVNKFLTQYFEQYVNYQFTAQLEDDLDTISRGECDWIPVMESFWKPFKEKLEHIQENVSREHSNPARELGTDPKSGKPVSVRLGRYGPFAQIGSREDEEKPRFASLRGSVKLDTITLEEALRLFELPRMLGQTPEGEEIEANIGRFGPYLRYGDKFASLYQDQDPYTIELEEALIVITEKKKADLAKILKEFPEEKIQVLKGRWGPYLIDENKTKVNLGKDFDIETLTAETCKKILAKKQATMKNKKTAPKKAAAKKKKTPSKK